MKKYTKQGRIISRDNKELFRISRVNQGNNIFNMSPCECDAMSYFILDALNNRDFKTYYKKYMEL